MVEIRKLKPTSPGARHVVRVKTHHLAADGPKKSLVEKKNRLSGRNNAGRITVRHRGGGHKKHYRVVDFKRNMDGIPAKVTKIEYDPNRSAHLALVSYLNGRWSYIIATKNMRVGDTVLSGSEAPIKPGNTLQLSDIPQGTVICCIELNPGQGAKLTRSAGASASLVSKDGQYVLIKLKSGEVRKVLASCRATIGVVSNDKHNLKELGKAGAKRWRGIRPTVRGVAMNPVDHPHGGGEGRTSGGRPAVSPTGVKAKGKKTRNNKRTNKLIVTRRKKRD